MRTKTIKNGTNKKRQRKNQLRQKHFFFLNICLNFKTKQNHETKNNHQTKTNKKSRQKNILPFLLCSCVDGCLPGLSYRKAASSQIETQTMHSTGLTRK